MVKVKIACKDVSKIPKKRLFEMKDDIYLIQFKVREVVVRKSQREVMMERVMTLKMLMIMGWRN
jgi:hypothetical protein